MQLVGGRKSELPAESAGL